MIRMRHAALAAIAVLVAASATASFCESYRGLLLWAEHHGLHGVWAAAFPAQVDTFIAVGELALFVALVDRWSPRSRAAAWTVTLAGLAVSVAGNIGHVAGHSLASRATAAIPPLAAASALAVGLGVLKRVVEHHHQAGHGQPAQIARDVPTSARQAATLAYAASVRGGNPLSGRALERQFGISRSEAAKVRSEVATAANGHEGR
jgi:Protein of unknown function (DUF2637)